MKIFVVATASYSEDGDLEVIVNNAFKTELAAKKHIQELYNDAVDNVKALVKDGDIDSDEGDAMMNDLVFDGTHFYDKGPNQTVTDITVIELK